MENMQHKNEQQQQHMMKKMDADLLLPVQDYDPEGKRIYHPAIGKRAFWFGLIGGVIIAFVFWMVASGHWPVTGLGQMSSAQYGAAAFMGFAIGSAIGGLMGSLSGLGVMLREEKTKTTAQ